MQKIMGYRQEPIDYSRRLKYILVNIIEMIPELRDLNIEFMINNSLEFKAWFEYYGTSTSFMCGLELNSGNMIQDDSTFKLTLFIKDLFKYFNLYNIDLFDEQQRMIAIWIFVTLHELGHIKYYNRFKNKYLKLEPLVEQYESKLTSILNSNNLETMESYFMSPTELYADQFAYRYFPYIWNNLKQLNLI